MSLLLLPLPPLQSKEVERLNGVYGQILSKAGVEVIGGCWAMGLA